ncbi:MAG: hypothetical protein U1E76_07065 [Planctomycetota bacterium]
MVACTSVGAGTDYDVATLKYSPSSNLLWERRFDGPASGFDDCSTDRDRASDNVYVAADTYSLGTGSYDFAVLKYDASGSLVWVETYDDPDHGDETIYAIALDAAASVYVTASRRVSRPTATSPRSRGIRTARCAGRGASMAAARRSTSASPSP